MSAPHAPVEAGFDPARPRGATPPGHPARCPPRRPSPGAAAHPATPRLATAGHGRAGLRDPAGLQLRADPRQRHRLPGLQPLSREQSAGGVPQSNWIGFGQFQLLFEDPAFWDAFRNTLAITAFQLVFFFPLPILLAIGLHNLLSSRLRGFVQTVVYLPHFFSWVLVVTFFVAMFGGAGLLAQTMREAGMEPWNIMTNPDTFIILVTAEAIWKDVGWGTIIFLAALSTIDQNSLRGGGGRRCRPVASAVAHHPARPAAGDRAAAHPASR